MVKQMKIEEERNRVGMPDGSKDKRKVGCDEMSTKRRKLHFSRDTATMCASRVNNKVSLQKEKGLISDSIALRVKRLKSSPQSNLRSQRYDDVDNIYFLTEMIKLAESGVDERAGFRKINVGQLHRHLSKRFGCSYTHKQAYEKARRLRDMYMNKFLKTSEDQHAPFEDANKEEVFKLCRQLWGDCGVLKLYLEDEDGPLSSNDGLGFTSRDADSSREDDSHGLEGVGPGEGGEIVKGVCAEGDNIVKEKHVGVCQDVVEKIVEKVAEPGSSLTEWNAQRAYEALHDKHQELLHNLEKKCESVLDGFQVKLMNMVTNALETRNEAPAGRFFDLPKPAGFTSNDVFVERMFAASMQECNKSVPKHLQDRWQRLHAEELKLVSDRLRLMLDICQFEQEKMERQARHS
eukprot:c23784_g1_i1 orf=381-1595(-)